MAGTTWEDHALYYETESSHLIDMVLEARGTERTGEAIVGVLEEVQQRIDRAKDAEHERIMDELEAGVTV